MDGVTLREPGWLLLALLPLLALRLGRRERLARWAEPALRPWALRRVGGNPWRSGILALAWVLLAVAAAGPRHPLPDETGHINTRSDVALMALVEADAGEEARIELHELIRHLRGERLGIAVYGRSAGLVNPPTADTSALGFYVDLIPAFADNDAEGFVQGLRVAARALPRSGPRALVILTRGPANANVDSQAAVLAHQGIAVHVLALAPDASLKRLAEAGGGRYVEAVSGDTDWNSLYDDTLAQLPSRGYIRHGTWRELYPWFLAPALALFLLSRMPSTRALPLLLFTIAAFSTSRPASADESAAYGAYRAGDYARAQAAYASLPGSAARLGEGASAYRRGDFLQAVKAFRFAALTATDTPSRAVALYDLGNAALRGNDPALAVAAYRGALSLRDDPRTRSNLAIAEARLAGLRAKQERGPRPGHQVSEYTVGRDEDSNDFPPDELPKTGAGRSGKTPAGARNAHASWSASERDYYAGLKKIELVEDRPAELLRQIMEGEVLP